MLATRGVAATAVVTKLTPSNHNQVYFAYEVDGERYSLNDFARGERVGDELQVTYLPEDPAIAVRGVDFSGYGMPGWTAFPFVGLMFATIAMVMAVIRPLLPSARARGGTRPPGSRAS